MPRFGLLSLTLACLSATAGAQERVPAFVDMRLNLEGTYLVYSLNDVEQSNDLALRGGVSWTGSLGINRWGGVVWGLGGSLGYGKDEGVLSAGQDLTIQTGTIDFFVGYAYAFTEFLQIEAMPTIGVGRAWVRTSDPNSGSDAAAYWEYGMRGNITWTLDNGFQWGLLGNLMIANNNDLDLNINGEVIDDFDNTRISVGAFIGVRL